MPWIANPSLHWLSLCHFPSPTPVHRATKKPQAVTVKTRSAPRILEKGALWLRLTHLSYSRNSRALVCLDRHGSALCSLSPAESQAECSGSLTLAISAPKTGATPVMVPTA